MITDKDAKELIQRTTRIETRVTRGFKALGIDVMDDSKKVALVASDPPILEMSGLDVSFGDVLAFCRKSGISGIVTVVFKGHLYGSVSVAKETDDATT